jgi:ATP-dependent DNA helicase DinG
VSSSARRSPAHSDPIVEARIAAIRKTGGKPFDEFQVPEAVLALKQGFGRLIRSAQDRGVLVLLDNRVMKQRYGKVFLDSLPDYAFSTDIADVARFFDPPTGQ